MRRNSNRSNSSLGPILTVIFIVVIIVCMSSIYNSEGTQQPSNAESTDAKNNTTITQTVDLSSFSEKPAISALINVEKKSNSRFLDIDVLLHNYSDKDIVELQLFLVCVDVSVEAKKTECIALSLSDLKMNMVMRQNRIVSSKMTATCEYQAYVTHILYADGNEWGLKEADQFSVVDCGYKVDVCYYENGVSKDAVEKRYIISYSAQMISNSHVGDSWSYGIMYNDQVLDITEDVCLLVDSQAGPKLTIKAIEYDSAENDVGKEDILFSNISIGESETVVIVVTVVEGDGRYIGHKAYIEFTVTIRRIG